MKRHLAPLTLLAWLTAAPAFASEWHATVDTNVYTDVTTAARSHLQRHAVDLNLHSVDLVERKPVTASGFRTVRFEQTYDGLPVIGGQAAVRVNAQGRVSATVLNVARDLSVTTLPSVSMTMAQDVATSRAGVNGAAHSRAMLAVLPDGQDGLLIWQVDVQTLDGGWRYWIDAHDGSLVHERPLAVHALGTVYPIDSVTTPDTENLELLHLVPSDPQLLTGWDGNITVTNYVSGDSQSGNYKLEQTLEPNSGEDFLFAPPEDKRDDEDGFAQVSIYYHLTRMRDFATNTLGIDMSDSSWKLVAVANMQEGGSPMDNAFFSPGGIGSPWNAPNLIAIGQGASFDFAQDSDVFNHEFTHYLTENAVGYNAGSFHIDAWGRSHFSGAIDEGISDYFASTVNGDSFLGEASLALLGSGRDLEDTSRNCPEGLDGEVHADGELIGSLAWSLREALGAELADELVWGGVSLLTLGAPFGDFANGLLQTADDMVTAGRLTPAQVIQIEEILASRGLDDCGNEIALGASREVRLDGFGHRCQQARQSGFSLQTMFHYVVTPGEDALGVEIDVDIDGLSPNDPPLWSLYVRAGEHVTFSPAFPPKVFGYDYALENVTLDSGKIVIDEISAPAFEPGTTYHLVVTHQQCSPSLATISARDILTPPSTGEGGMGAGGAGGADNALDDTPTEVSGGCGCRTAGAPAKGLGWVLALMAAAALRRRRSR